MNWKDYYSRYSIPGLGPLQKLMNILMLLCTPFTNDARVYNEARSLIDAGHKVTVIAFDYDQRNKEVENWDGISIYRLRSLRSVRSGFGWPIRHGILLMQWQLMAYAAAVKLHRISGFQAVHAHDFDSLVAGILIKKKLGIPLVYDVHEIYSYIVEGSFPCWIARIFALVEKILIRYTDYIVTVTEAVKRYLEGITNKPVTIVMNCKYIEVREYTPPDNDGNFKIIYLGLLDEWRNLRDLIHVVGNNNGVSCTIGGFGRPWFVNQIQELCSQYSNVNFVGLVPMQSVIPLTLRSDCVFYMIDPAHKYSQVAIGNKQFEAMACGRPIICTKGTYAGEMAEQENVGITAVYTEEGLYSAIMRLRNDPELRETLGRNGLELAINKYNWPKQQEQLLKIYGTIGLCKLTN